MTLHSALKSWNIANKRILLRADLNAPIANGSIANDYRLQSLQPTIDYIQTHGGIIVLMSHIGRPKQPTPELSTQILVPWFRQKGYEITWCPDIATAHQKSLENNKQIILIENLRFFPGETSGDKTFAQELARCGDYYIDDAFGSLHRNDASITLVPQFFAPDHRSIGLLVEKELQMLDRLISAPQKPFVLIAGGGKVADKIPLLLHMLDKVTDILLCPATVFSFLSAQGKAVGKSLVDNQAAPQCLRILSQAQERGVTIHFPVDYQIALDAIDGKLMIVDADAIPFNGVGISIGPKTVDLFSSIIANAHTLFFNAAMGFAYRKETLEGTLALLHAVAKSNGFSVVGGGDSVAAAQQLEIGNQISYLSTGGGATLSYLSGQKLPGLEALSN
ncbi:MAG: phosphoglycerate kinase [Candidatus Babeliales bacterium]|nr:phosphoglycerate kinase [Candidatus Babeliales bacterium]